MYFELKHYLDLDLIDAQISSTVGAAEQEHLVEVWSYFIDCKEGRKGTESVYATV